MSGQDLILLAASEIIIADGAMGTMLQAHGMTAGVCPELWNVEHADAVGSVYAAYIAAGSRMIGTNTFGGNRIKLDAYGLSDRVAELNHAGVALARAAAGPDNFVAASIGPTGKFLEPLGDMTFEEAEDVFEEQARAQVDAGADVIIMETFSDLPEIKAALKGALKTGMPCFCTMAFDTGGRTMMGIDPVTAALELTDHGASGVGANCGLGPDGMLDIVAKMREITCGIVIAQPNAGLPEIVNGQTVYNSSAEEMAAYAIRFAQMGINIIGGCCGTTPEHIRAIAKAVRM